MLNASLTKTDQNNQGVLSSVLLYSGRQTILIFSTFSSQNVPQRGIVANYLQYSSEILKWLVDHHINIKVLILNFFQLEIDIYCQKCLSTQFDYMSKVEASKNENNSFSLLSVFYRLWTVRSFAHPSLIIIYGFCPDAIENRL